MLAVAMAAAGDSGRFDSVYPILCLFYMTSGCHLADIHFEKAFTLRREIRWAKLELSVDFGKDLKAGLNLQKAMFL